MKQLFVIALSSIFVGMIYGVCQTATTTTPCPQTTTVAEGLCDIRTGGVGSLGIADQVTVNSETECCERCRLNAQCTLFVFSTSGNNDCSIYNVNFNIETQLFTSGTQRVGVPIRL